MYNESCPTESSYVVPSLNHELELSLFRQQVHNRMTIRSKGKQRMKENKGLQVK